MNVGLITHPDCLLHDMGIGHPEQPDRMRVIQAELIRSGLDNKLKHYFAPKVTREQLLQVHAPDYIDMIYQVAPQSGFAELDPDTWMNPYTLQAAEYAAGATVHAVDLVMKKEINSAFCNIRPPGHHAERSRAMGFCFFNNIAVGVAHALEQHKLKRVAIIDFDVHHGNGTEDIFRHDERVLLCSSFQHPFYPFGGADTKSHHMLNTPLPAGTTGQTFREIVAEAWLPAINNFQPEMIFFSAGFDAHESDEMAHLKFQTEDYGWITSQIKQIADQYAEGRMISALEGGYALEVLGACAVSHIKAMLF